MKIFILFGVYETVEIVNMKICLVVMRILMEIFMRI